MAQNALRVQFVLAGIVVLGVLVQVYLIACYVFGADTLDAHKNIGGVVHILEVLTFVAALVSKRERPLSAALAVIGTIQLALAGADEYVGGLHGLFAMAVLGLAAVVHLRTRPRHTTAT